MKNHFLILFLAAIGITVGSYFLFGKQTTNVPTDQIQESVTIESAKCTGNPTPSQTEGPYYKTGSPQRNNIAEGVSGEKLLVIGYVYDKNCKPIVNAWLDFWHADANGVYDNAGYKLRGHQFTDENGMYRLETIIPARYESRPAHIHVKVQPPNRPILTSQMYFPNDPQNQTDPIFNQELVMAVKDNVNGKIAEFNFVLNLGSQNQNTIILPSPTPSPSITEKVDIQASFAIITDNITRSFKAEKYHNQSPNVFITKDNPSIVFVKQKGTTWQDFFNTLPMKLTKDCLTTGDRETLCNGEQGGLKFYLNDIEDEDLLDREIKEADLAKIIFSTFVK